MANTKALIDPTMQKKSFGWYTGLSGCLESSGLGVTPTKRKLKDSVKPESSSSEDDEDEEDNAEVFSQLAQQIDDILTIVIDEEDGWLGHLRSDLNYSSQLIKSLSRSSKAVYDSLKLTKFQDVAGTTESICAILGKTHWAAAGLLVVAAILHNIQQSRTNDKECLELLRSIRTVAVSLNRLNNLPRAPPEMEQNLKRARDFIPKGTALCLEVVQSTCFRKFLQTRQNYTNISLCKKQLDRLREDIEFQVVIALYAEPRETGGKDTVKKKKQGGQQQVGVKNSGQTSGNGQETTTEKNPGGQQQVGGKNSGQTSGNGQETKTDKEGEDTARNSGSGQEALNDDDGVCWNIIKKYKTKLQNRCKCRFSRNDVSTLLQCLNILHRVDRLGDKQRREISNESEAKYDEPANRIEEMLQLNSEEKDLAALLWVSEDMGKDYLVDELYSILEGKQEWFTLRVVNSFTVTSWQRGGHKKGDEREIEIEADGGWKSELSAILPNDKNVLIYLDNVAYCEILKKLLPHNHLLNKKTRLLVTVDDKHGISALESFKFHKKLHVMQPLSYEKALKFFVEWLQEPRGEQVIDRDSVVKIIQLCNRYKYQLKNICDDLSKMKDKDRLRKLSEWVLKKGPSLKELKEYISCEKRFRKLPEHVKDAFLDICSFFNNMEWNKLACIVGNDALKELEEMELIKKKSSTVSDKQSCRVSEIESYTVSVPAIVREFAFSLSKGNRVNNAADLYTSLFVQKVREMKGIWLLQSKIPFYLSTEKLSEMCGSLRVLALGDHTILRGKCTKKFKELRYFQVGRGAHYPSNMTNPDEPSYLEIISNKGVALASGKVQIPLNPRMLTMKTNNAERCAQLHDRLPKGCKLVEVDMSDSNVEDLKNELCELCYLERLILNKCNKIKRMPERFGTLRSLKMVDLSNCTELISLPSDFGWLSGLEILNLSYCRKLKDLPESMGLLNSVREIDMSYCKQIEKLPKNIIKLSTLRSLRLKGCSRLYELPENFEKLFLKELSLESCKRLKALPEGTAEQTLSETTVSLSWCFSIPELSFGFINLIKVKVEHLILTDCKGLKILTDDFTTELSLLKTLNLSGCTSLRYLPKRLKKLECLQTLNLSSCVKLEESSIVLRRLPSLIEINLSNCPGLKGSCFKRLTKLKSLRFVDIHDSANLVEKWEQMIRQNTELNFTVATGRPSLEPPAIRLLRVFPESKAVGMAKGDSQFFNSDWFFANVNGQPFYPSTLEEGTTVAVIFYRFQDQEDLHELGNLLDDLYISYRELQVLYVGKFVTPPPKEFTGQHRICSCDSYEALVFFEKQSRTIESFDENNAYRMIMSEVVMKNKNVKAFGPWRGITNSSLNEFKVTLPTSEYFRVKELIETPSNSNVELLKELLLTKEANFLINGENQVGIEELEGKVIFLLISWLDKFEDEQETFKNVYEKLKEKMQENPEEKSKFFEVVWIPIVSHGRGTPALYANLVQEIAWPSIANPWCMNPSANRFLRMRYSPDKLPLFIAISPEGQFHFENFIPLEEDDVIKALQDYIKENSPNQNR